MGEDGACGLNYEHSPSEGIAVVQLIEHVLRYMYVSQLLHIYNFPCKCVPCYQILILTICYNGSSKILFTK